MEDESRATDAPGEHDDGAGQQRLRRRTVLRAGVAGGLATGLGWTAGATLLDGDSTGTITYALARPEPERGSLEPRRKSVPADWYRRLRLAISARERLRDLTVEPLVGAAVVPGTYDDPTAGLSVTATTEGVLDVLEELAPSVPVDVDVVDRTLLEPDSNFDLSEAYQVRRFDRDDLPGGVICEGADIYGTLAPALIDADTGDRYFATSNHVFGAGGAIDSAHVGTPLSVLHDDEPHRVGEVVRGYPAADVVQVAPAGPNRPASRIARADAPGVVGQYTLFGLADLAARGEPLTKFGAVTDRTTGQIHGVDGVTCYTGQICKTGQLTWGSQSSLSDGDSGSVAVHADPEHPDEYALVAGINSARTRWIGDFTWGTAAHHLLAEYGLHF